MGKFLIVDLLLYLQMHIVDVVHKKRVYYLLAFVHLGF